MNDKIVDLITRLADTGSSTALWFYGIYVLGTVLKFIIGFGCGLASIVYIGKIAKQIAKEC